MRIDLNNPKKYLWPLNVLTFNACRLIPFRDRHLWIFGAWEGEKYDDNSRAFFEYMNAKHRDSIRCVWLTNKEIIANQVKSLGYEAYTSESIEGKRMQRKAGVSIYTNGLMDFGLHPKIAGSLIVSLWHGVGFKKIYNAKYYGLKLAIKKIMDCFFSWTYRNITMVTSQYVLDQFRDCFGLSKKAKMVITGQPRNDIFKRITSKKIIQDKLNIARCKQMVLYMPTYRGNGMPKNAMETIIRGLYDNQKFNIALDCSNSVFIVKLHPMTPHINIESRANFIILDNNAVSSNQELLAASDILVTDYSSCIVDFALLNRPVIFYLPDHKDFIEKSEPLFDEFFELCKKNACSDSDALCEKILNPSLAAVKSLNQLYQDPSIEGSCYSENVFNAIVKELK